MKANELRIGNLVRVPNSDELKRDYPLCDLSSLKIRAMVFRHANLEINETFNEGVYFEYIEPIPLTEEWLLKLGFKTMNYERNLCNYTLDCTPKNYKYKYALQTKIGSCGSALLPIRWTPMERSGDSHAFPCEYVHQLQNLYFTLTGEELTIKD